MICEDHHVASKLILVDWYQQDDLVGPTILLSHNSMKITLTLLQCRTPSPATFCASWSILGKISNLRIVSYVQKSKMQ